MYIKLTRFDNRPVWLNAAFVVALEAKGVIKLDVNHVSWTVG